jgi:hypothetical protein
MERMKKYFAAVALSTVIFSGCAESLEQKPVGHILPSTDVAAEQNRYIELDISRCMKREGFDYRPVPRNTPGAFRSDLKDFLVIVGNDQYGYGFTIGFVTANRVKDPNVMRYGNGEFDRALLGSSSSPSDQVGGCRGKARKSANRRFPDATLTSTKLEMAVERLAAKIDANRIVSKGDLDWRRCMKKIDVSYESGSPREFQKVVALRVLAKIGGEGAVVSVETDPGATALLEERAAWRADRICEKRYYGPARREIERVQSDLFP